MDNRSEAERIVRKIERGSDERGFTLLAGTRTYTHLGDPPCTESQDRVDYTLNILNAWDAQNEAEDAYVPVAVAESIYELVRDGGDVEKLLDTAKAEMSEKILGPGQFFTPQQIDEFIARLRTL